MSLPYGAHYRIKTFPLGKRIRLTILHGRVIETKVIARTKQTRSRKSLRRARRRIGL